MRKKRLSKSVDAVTHVPLSWSLEMAIIGTRCYDQQKNCVHVCKSFMSVSDFVFCLQRILSKTR